MSRGCQEAPSFLPSVTPTIYTFKQLPPKTQSLTVKDCSYITMLISDVTSHVIFLDHFCAFWVFDKLFGQCMCL